MKESDYELARAMPNIPSGNPVALAYSDRNDGRCGLMLQIDWPGENAVSELTRIVTAVNAHDDLVEALGGVVEFLEYHGCANYEEDTGACCTNNVDDWREYCPICKARAALKKARGEDAEKPDE